MSLIGKWYGFGSNPAFDDGLRAYESENWSAAAESFRLALDETKDPALREQARFYLAEAYTKQGREAVLAGRYESAVESLRAAIEIHPEYPDLHLRLAIPLAKLGEVEGAKAELGEALRLNRSYARARELKVLLDEGKPLPDETEGEARGQDANALARQAEALANENQEQASILYRRALEIAPTYADIRCRYGELLLARDDVDDALAQFDEAISLNPKYAEAHAQRGIALRRLGLHQEAKLAFKTALEHDLNHIIAGLEVQRR